MLLRVYDDLFLEHGVPWHPENAERLRVIEARLRDAGLWAEMAAFDPVPATREQLRWVHAGWYLDDLQALSAAGGEALDPDTVATERTWDAACLAAGGCLAAAELLLSGADLQALCLVRPPGHHALPDRAMGFCFLNNPALAAEAALRAGARRVAIFDCDAHHGNGVQEIFYPRGDVLYLSLHEQHLFPGTGTVDELGVDAGLGFNVNLPLPSGASGAHCLRAWDELFAPLLRRFQPDLILLDAGYDGHWRDPLTHLALSADFFHELTGRVLGLARELCQGRLQVLLEGGYDLDALALCVENTVLALLDRPLREPDAAPSPAHPHQLERVEQYLDRGLALHHQRLGV